MAHSICLGINIPMRELKIVVSRVDACEGMLVTSTPGRTLWPSLDFSRVLTTGVRAGEEVTKSFYHLLCIPL